jgi:GNAT superfamily N-acetyltransferase
MENQPIIRFAQLVDLECIIQLCEEHAHFEKASYDRENKSEKLGQYLFGEKPVLTCLVVEYQSKIRGYATVIKQFSTWDADYYLYLDCLFLQPDLRGLGIGRKIMEKIKLLALEKNCQLIQWQTPYFNQNAILFYEKIGAYSKNKERFFWEISS